MSDVLSYTPSKNKFDEYVENLDEQTLEMYKNLVSTVEALNYGFYVNDRGGSAFDYFRIEIKHPDLRSVLKPHEKDVNIDICLFRNNLEYVDVTFYYDSNEDRVGVDSRKFRTKDFNFIDILSYVIERMTFGEAQIQYKENENGIQNH